MGQLKYDKRPIKYLYEYVIVRCDKENRDRINSVLCVSEHILLVYCCLYCNLIALYKRR